MPAKQFAYRQNAAESHSNWADTALFGLYEISKILCAPMETVTLIKRVISVLENFIDLNRAAIALFDENQEPDMIVSAKSDHVGAKAYFDSIPEQVLGQIVTSKMPLIIRDITQDKHFSFGTAQGWELHEKTCVIGVPILDRDKVSGILFIDRPTPRNEKESLAPDRDARMLSMVAGLLGQTVRLHRMVRREHELLLKKSVPDHDPAPPSSTENGPNRIIGNSPAIRAILDKINLIAKNNVTVLLRGESGTGKELFSQAIHMASPRSKHPFVKLNCAALPESVLESELFGHEKGAFTGAVSMRKGRFELADGGTLFLDEIGEISPNFQAKLLRVLQEGEFERVGGTRTLKVDVRVIAATNVNLEEAVSRGDFRADLYYRLSVIPIFLPPLREHPSDIPLLAKQFLKSFNQENNTNLSISSDALEVLSHCYFPGNVRELENCIRRTATLARGSDITAEDFTCHDDNCLSSIFWQKPPQEETVKHSCQSKIGLGGVQTPCPSSSTCAAAANQGDQRSQKEDLIDAMEKAGWVQAKAARILGMTPRQIGYALRKNGISIKKF
ncbi:nif-specific transcriptional activator NifA [Zymomonas mobilis]|uniref:Nif-specific regulatory protein n=1 Tax=Zymomonas mobilis subsp. pomaceae (strain ATCC 29192 / DSM 22645 / JCM 10191 / CCUG 17912 / NBRC 13757 / NCIMB 11200 / NRRL B-4491 / Barker I) TaxID=579138 RepID=F8EUR2_ZYMMT|nr:nif-specific transcriptional activator NifA [Zymomonas mobilis]AEI38208.1 transcriptional regulator, NifA, Fis Family [Zymomonas mobilis subsp. pomaceae ATCC 29192]MDX5947898.1 nif-specific transcriptional activator NifA [Zymomonas mobilis subsp. pomaceae]GEB89937.1 nif-specific regulatory protein [Zymomonas mobilis subsp. pomaceae]